MVEVFRWFCREDDERAAILNGFARMLAFDALVGAPDRHATNWGVLVSLVADRPKEFAPLFDTARGLFREHPDSKLIEIQEAGRQEEYIRAYALKSRPVFGVGGGAGAPRCNHFDLIQCAIRDLPTELGGSVARFIRAVRMPELGTLIWRRFRRVISPTRVSFILGLLQHRYERLIMLVEGTSNRR